MAGLTLAKRSAVIGAALLVIIIVLFIGRVVGFPVAVVIVSGRSMEPTLRVGDLVVGVKSSFNVGDIVIWCTGPTYCVVHRVISISGSTIVTKGDNNPAPDPPISASLVKYKVILIVPREVWLSVIAALLITYAYVRRDYFRRQRIAPGDIASLILVSFIVFNASVALLAPTYYSLRAGNLEVPWVTLKHVSLVGNGTAIISLDIRNTKLISVTYCSTWLYGEKRHYNCVARITSGFKITVSNIPSAILEKMLEEGKGPLLVRVKVAILFGELSGVYYIYPAWKGLVVNINNGTVIVRNPNPAPIRVNITTYTANKPGLAKVTLHKYVIAPQSEVKIDLSKYRYAYVRVEYIIRGKLIVRQFRVRS